MAIVDPIVSWNNDFTVIKYFYEALANGDSGTPFKAPENADKSVQVVGTFGTGGTIGIEGSNLDAPSADANFFALTGDSNNPLDDEQAAFGDVIIENTEWVRPHVTAGDGSTDLDVYFVVRRQTDKRS